MTWVKIDDRFWRNRKVRKAWRANPSTVGLYVMALSYCNEELSDGFVDPEWLQYAYASLNGKGEKAAQEATQILVDVGLWEPFGDGWQIHDYLEYQPSSKRIEAIRESRRIAGALGGKKSGEARGRQRRSRS